MASMNRVYLLGNLTRDPVLRRLGSGAAVADIGLAINENGEGRGNNNGNGDAKKPAVCFVDIVAWNKLAENCGAYLAKGSQVLVEGRLQLDEWSDDNGNKRSKLRVLADRVQFLSRLAKAPQDGEPEPASPARQDRPVGPRPSQR
jgi:single-strand DNA-binding protein